MILIIFLFYRNVNFVDIFEQMYVMTTQEINLKQL
jgi:hypothetical protein